MSLSHRRVEVPGYFRYVVIAGLIGALVLIHLAEEACVMNGDSWS